MFTLWGIDVWQDRLLRRLTDVGWTQAELARRAGIPYARVRKWFSGKTNHPRGEALAKICAVLDISEHWLVYGLEADEGTLGADMPFHEFPSLAEVLMEPGVGYGAQAGSATKEGPEFSTRMPDASMMPRIQPGSLLHCRAMKSPGPGSVVVVHIADEDRVVVRTLREPTPKKVSLVPDNPAFPTYELDRDAGYTLLARVTHVLTAL